MANVKISALAVAATILTTDILPVVIDPAGTPTTKRATVAVIRGSLTTDAIGTLPVANGGTGVTSLASGVIHSNGTVLSSSAVVLTSEVSGTLPIGNGGTGAASLASGVIHSNGSVLSSSAVVLTSEVSGTLPVANGGTGITSLGTGVATFLGTPSSANLLAALTDETGTGACVFATNPTMTAIITDYIATSGTIATAGIIRLPAADNTVLAFRNGANTQNLIGLLWVTATAKLFIGTDASFTAANQVSAISMYVTTSGSISMGIAGTTYLVLNGVGALIECWKPLSGSSSASRPYTRSSIVITFASADITMTATQYLNPNLILAGTVGATQNLIGPTVADGEFTIRNTTTGIITIKKSGGTGVAIAAGFTARVRFDSTAADYVRVTADSAN